MLRAAVEVFNERGYYGTSMEDLSRRLGIAKSGIYHHVSGKEELLRMALDRALDGLWEAAERARSLDALRPSSGLRPWSGARWRCSSHSCRTSRCCCGCGATPRWSGPPLDRRQTRSSALVASLVAEAEAERDGDIRADIDPRLTARLLFGTVNSIVEWYRPVRLPASSIAEAVPGSVSLAGSAVCAITFDGTRRVRR